MRLAFIVLSMVLVGGAAPVAAAPGMTVEEILSLSAKGEDFRYWAQWPHALRRGYKTRVVVWKNPVPPPGKLRFTGTWKLRVPLEVLKRGSVLILRRQPRMIQEMQDRINGSRWDENNFSGTIMIYPDRSWGRGTPNQFNQANRTIGSGRFVYTLPWPGETYGVQIVRPEASPEHFYNYQFGTPLVLRSVVTSAIRFREPTS